VPGGLQLHPHQSARTFPPCLLKLQLPADQLLRILAEAAPDWQQLPVLSDADITARATRLGLLPAKTLAAQGVLQQQQQAMQSSCCIAVKGINGFCCACAWLQWSFSAVTSTPNADTRPLSMTVLLC
jgi:hypothetical protein